MPVNTPNREYQVNQKRWERCRDTTRGEDAVKAKKGEYLPPLTDQNTSEYNAYLTRAEFFPAAARTVEGIVGAVFRKDPTILNFSDEDWLRGVGKQRTPFNNFARNVFHEVIAMGRFGVLVDVVDDDASADKRPYWVGYTAETIINWTVEQVAETIEGEDDGEFCLKRVVLKEVVEEQDSDDEFVIKEVEQYRVLELIPVADEGPEIYTVQLWRKDPNSSRSGAGAKDEFVRYEGLKTPTVRGMPLQRIPFVFFGPDDLSANVQKPPILDIVGVNLSHYRNSADLEQGRHYTSLPTPWAAGFQVAEGEKLRLGSTAAWVSETPTATAGFLEYTGQGLKSLETALEHKEAQMAVLGARMLESQKRAVEAAETHRVRRSGEESIVASVAGVASEGFTKLLAFSEVWLTTGPQNDLSAELNTDFVMLEMTAQLLQALTATEGAGKISYQTYFWNLQRGELIPEGVTWEDELERIEQERVLVGDQDMDLDEEEEEDAEDPEDEEDEEEEEPELEEADDAA